MTAKGKITSGRGMFKQIKQHRAAMNTGCEIWKEKLVRVVGGTSCTKAGIYFSPDMHPALLGLPFHGLLDGSSRSIHAGKRQLGDRKARCGLEVQYTYDIRQCVETNERNGRGWERA